MSGLISLPEVIAINDKKKRKNIVKKNILGLTQDQLKSEFIASGLTVLDAKRVFPWIHVKSVLSFEEMSDVPKNTRPILDELFSLERPVCKILQKSSDGSMKALLALSDGNSAETVFIPEKSRNTVCVSSQIGCAMKCKFCYTGTQQFTRNLTSSEIMAQIFFWKDMLKQQPSKFDYDSLSNIVFMGMGEPLLNYQNVANSLEILLGAKSHNFSRKKITVSTSGIATDDLEKLSKFGVKLAVSLHAPNDQKRSKIMPINNKYHIADVLKAAEKYLKLSNTDHITFEYLMLKNVNDSKEDAKQLVKLLHGIRGKINLIIFNAWPSCELQGSSRETADKFAKFLIARGLRATIRKSKGEDILAACGQLKSVK